MKLGTGIYLDKFRQDPSFYKENYNYLEIQDFIMPTNLDLLKEEILEKYMALLEDYQGYITLHGPYIDLKATSFDPLVQEVFLARARKILDIAKILKAQYVVFHSDYEKKSRYENDYNVFFLNQSISVWRTLVQDFEKAGVTALIENVHNPDGSIIAAIIDSIDSPYLGACLDVGHAHVFGKVTLQDWINCYGNYLKYVHLSDNHGEEDEHLPLGKGNIQLSAFFTWLSKIQFMPVLIFEAFGDTKAEKSNLEYLKTNM